jgi:hypothetical protein
MNDRVAELLLAVAIEAGAMDAFVLLYELDALASGKVFPTTEVCARALIPGNVRLRAAIEAACGEV